MCTYPSWNLFIPFCNANAIPPSIYTTLSVSEDINQSVFIGALAEGSPEAEKLEAMFERSWLQACFFSNVFQLAAVQPSLLAGLFPP